MSKHMLLKQSSSSESAQSRQSSSGTSGMTGNPTPITAPSPADSIPQLPAADSPQLKRTNSVISTASSLVEPPWARQFILSFDGGGIRGYSSLLIVRALIDQIALVEQEEPAAESSFSPKIQPTRAETHTDDHEKRREEIGGWSIGAWIEGIKARRELERLDREGSRERNGSASHDEHSEAYQKRKVRDRYLPCHYFDYIGGTSTGGLISIMLSRLRMSVDDALAEYENLSGQIFGHPRLFSVRGPIPFPRDKYSSKRVVDVVKSVVSSQTGKKPLLGQDLFASPRRMCKTIVVSYMSRNVEDGTVIAAEPPYLFRSYDHHPHVPKSKRKVLNLAERNPGYAHRIPIWQVARATSAAPTYFSSITIEDQKFLDGGFGCNNPAMEIYQEVCQMNGNEKKYVGLLISIGTGQSKMTRFSSKPGRLSRYTAFLRAAKQLATNSEEVHHTMQDRLRATNEDDEPRYYRFNVPYSSPKKSRISSTQDATPRRRPKPLSEMALDEWKPESAFPFNRPYNTTLHDIAETTNSYLAQPEIQEDLRRAAKLLVESRRERSTKEYWELVSTGTQYRCVYSGCHSLKSQMMRESENSLRAHLRMKHGIMEKDEIDDFVVRGRCPS